MKSYVPIPFSLSRYTYDGNGNITSLTADLPAGQNDQVTRYVYGVSPSTGSLIHSNDLLAKVSTSAEN